MASQTNREKDDRDWLELMQSTKVKDLLGRRHEGPTRAAPRFLIFADRNATIEDTLKVAISFRLGCSEACFTG